LQRELEEQSEREEFGMDDQALLQINRDPRATIVTIVCSEFDFQRTKQFRDEMAGASLGDANLPLILDLAQVRFMPSPTLGALVELRSRFAREKRSFKLAGIQPAIVQVLQTTGMLSLFEVCNNVDGAIGGAPNVPAGR